MAIIRGILKGCIEWSEDPYFGMPTPKIVNGVKMAKFDLSKFYIKNK
jgi:hypothetical protein